MKGIVKKPFFWLAFQSLFLIVIFQISGKLKVVVGHDSGGGIWH